jgi:hypothetical protein
MDLNYSPPYFVEILFLYLPEIVRGENPPNLGLDSA